MEGDRDTLWEMGYVHMHKYRERGRKTKEQS